MTARLAKEAENIGAAVDKLIERFVDWQFTRREEKQVSRSHAPQRTQRNSLPERSYQRRDYRLDC